MATPLFVVGSRPAGPPRPLWVKAVAGIAAGASFGLFYLSAGFFFRVGGIAAEELPIRTLLSPTLLCIWHARSAADMRRCFSGARDPSKTKSNGEDASKMDNS